MLNNLSYPEYIVGTLSNTGKMGSNWLEHLQIPCKCVLDLYLNVDLDLDLDIDHDLDLVLDLVLDLDLDL